MNRSLASVLLCLLLATGCVGGNIEINSNAIWASGRADETGVSRERLAKLSDGMQDYINRGVVPGVVTLIYRQGHVVHADVLGLRDREAGTALSRDTIFRIYSMTKPVVSVATMVLVEEGKVRLSDPVTRWLPEFEKLRVLKDPAGPLNRTVALTTPITVRDLLTHTAGLAYSFTATGPLHDAIVASELGGANTNIAPDEFMRRLGALPLRHQPGTRWHYSLASDVLGVLVARASGQPLGEFLRERIFDPLGMDDTGFFVPEEKLARLAVNYLRDGETGELKVFDHPSKSTFAAEPPVFESGGGGLVSTADDYMRFARMLLQRGELDGVRVLSRKSVERMTADSLTEQERTLRELPPAFERAYRGQSFGLGVRVLSELGLTASISSEGTHGWGGAAGTWYFVDPTEDLIGVLMVQVMFLDDEKDPIRQDFGTLVYQAIAD